jgi:hypothetical protein
MPTEKLDSEIEAIRTVLAALEPLDESVRGNVLDYVLKRLKVHLPASVEKNVSPPPEFPSGAQTEPIHYKHIAELREEKDPQTAIEMAAVVAYYLSNYAPKDERTTEVGTTEMKTYFKIGGFKKKTDFRYLLPNAKLAGYFDSVEHGKYKLNAVGYNLVAHSLPKKKSKGSPK